ncbi:MAG: TonB-dependent receptor, partial [Bacteroidales bacterium]|nr:TonB-dependent receptor [Bacteroidales bacterium]
KTTTDMLGSYSVPVPPNLASTTYANSGKMINRGVELNVQGYIIDKPNLKWRSSLSASHNHQKIISLGEFTSSDGVRKDGYITGPGLIGNSNWVTGIIEGYEIGIFYVPELVLRSDGTPYLLDGEFVYKTSTGGYTTNIDQAQRYVAGSATPDFEIGFSNSFIIFKNWTVDINFRSMIGNDVYNATRMLLDYPGNLPNLNCLEDALTWAELGRTSGPAVCDYYVEDGSFLRLDYLALGYNFNMTRIKYIQTLRLYLASNNLFTITGYSGLDPETTIDGLSYGIDMYNVYPKTRSFTIGVNVTF